MVAVSIRELTHNFAKYLQRVKEGETIVVTERNVPIAELSPHAKKAKTPSWKRKIKPVKVRGESFTETLLKMREEERW